MPWGNPGVSELLQIQETSIQMPTTTGGQKTQTLQRSGLLRKLRFIAKAKVNVSAYTAAPTKSVYGPLGAFIKNIRIEANGQIPLVSLSGLGAAIYNEIQNRDGSILSTPAALGATVTNMGTSTALAAYPAIGATGDFETLFPFEFNFALPFNINGQQQELGLWLLQNQAVDLGISVEFNNPAAAAASNSALYGGGTLTMSGVVAGSELLVERELYTIPADPKDYPNLEWAHQVVEFESPFTGGFSRFAVPRAGLILRAIFINLDSSGLPIENTDISSLKWQYGSNDTPISRPGQMLNAEFVSDYNRNPPKGVSVLDFYKWGENGLKFVKSSEDLANLRTETSFASTSTGTQKIILERLIPIAAR
jgi:hypothetical protein